jgi:hypothetical protein
VGAGEREIGRRRPRLPDVLADRRADERLAQPEQVHLATRLEVAHLVEDAVVREEALRVDGLHLAACADRAAVGEIAVEPGDADERSDVLRLGRDLLDGPARLAEESRPEEEILGWVAGDRELGEEDEVGAGVARLPQPPHDSRDVPVEIADDGVDLGKREPHSFRLTVENIVYRPWRWSSTGIFAARRAPRTAGTPAACSRRSCTALRR